MSATFYCRCGAKYSIRSSVDKVPYECEVCHRTMTINLPKTILDSSRSVPKPVLTLLSRPSSPKMPETSDAYGSSKIVGQISNEEVPKNIQQSRVANKDKHNNINRLVAGSTAQRANRNTSQYSAKSITGVLDTIPVPARVYLRIDRSKEVEITNALEKNYPQLFEDYVGTNGKLKYILTQAFPEGIRGKYIVSNNQYKNDNGIDVLAILIRTTHSGFIKAHLPEGNQQLRIHGLLNSNNYLILDRVDIIGTTECTFNEKEIEFSVYYGDASGDSSFLRREIRKIPTYSEGMHQELAHWNEYLDWKQKLAAMKIFAAKYIGARFFLDDNNEPRLSFWTVMPSEVEFKVFSKAIMRERDQITIYTNRFSTDKWLFSYDADSKGRSEATLSLDFINRRSPYVTVWEDSEEYLYHNEALTSGTIEECWKYISNNKEQYPDPVFFELVFFLPDDEYNWFMDRWGYLDEYDDENTDEMYVQMSRRLLGRMPADGFIGTSQIGDFALNKRMKKALGDLEAGKAVSGNLGNWLFDIQKARAKSTHTQDAMEWSPWGEEHLNDSQKRIVQMMLVAQDVFLCQGPPGTGKTTVIAEAVYQLTKRNKRVLIASQTNLAVNNALSKLLRYEYPGIRAIRLGSERKIDDSVEAITDANILRTFYGNMCSRIQKSYIEPWEKADARVRQLGADLEVVQGLKRDIEEHNAKEAEYHRKRDSIDLDIKRERQLADERYEQEEMDRSKAMRLEKYAEDISRGTLPPKPLFLSEQQSEQLLAAIIEALSIFSACGFNVPPKSVILQEYESSSQRLKNHILHDYICLCLWIIKLTGTKAKDTVNEKSLKQIKEIDAEIREIMCLDDLSDDDLERIRVLKQQKKELQKGSNDLQVPTDDIIQFFPDEVHVMLVNSEKELNNIGFIKDDCRSAAVKAINQSAKCCVELAQALLPISGTADETIASLLKEKEAVNAAINTLHVQVEEGQKRLSDIGNQYGCSAENLEKEIISLIEEVSSRVPQDLDRHEFEGFFREMLSYVDSFSDDYSQENEQYLTAFINACNVVGISCTENSQTLTERGFATFDVAIIDEVSKATPPELLIPLLLAEKAILVGDHRQLPPLFGEHQESYMEYVDSVNEDDEESKRLLTPENYERFKELVTNSLFKHHYEQADPSNKGALLLQYRMHSEIMDVVNMFYDGHLKSGWSREEEEREKGHNATIYSYGGNARLITPEHHAYWIDSSSLHGVARYEQQEGSSKSNYLEVRMIACLVRQIEESYANLQDGQKVEIGIISFYMAQVKLIRSELERMHLKKVSVDVNTVDRFQGKEKEIVIVSMVRSIPAGRRYNASYVKSYQRVNVAVSRAQKLLLLVGSKNMYIDQEIELEDMETGAVIGKTPVYRNMIEMLNMHGCYLSADDILSPEENVIISKWEERRRQR